MENHFSYSDDEDEEEEESKFIFPTHFEHFCSPMIDKDGRVINHKMINNIIHYLFVDNNSPPNYQWVQSTAIIDDGKREKVAQYWEMIEKIEKSSIPKQDVNSVTIEKCTNVPKKRKDGVIYMIQSRDFGLELLSSSQFKKAVKKGERKLIDFFEKNGRIKF